MTASQISELNDIIDGLNSIDDPGDRLQFLESRVESVDQFLVTLKKIDKSKLRSQQKKHSAPLKSALSYQREDVIARFQKDSLEAIVAASSKEQLQSMYCAVYNTRPLSSSSKTQIAQGILKYIHDIHRSNALLGDPACSHF